MGSTSTSLPPRIIILRVPVFAQVVGVVGMDHHYSARERRT